MADTQETIADIIAEMRNRAKRPDFVSQDVLKSCADRLYTLAVEWMEELRPAKNKEGGAK